MASGSVAKGTEAERREGGNRLSSTQMSFNVEDGFPPFTYFLPVVVAADYFSLHLLSAAITTGKESKGSEG